MDKPISIIIRDMQESIIKAINDSGLPPSVIEPIIGGIYQQVLTAKTAELKQAEEDLSNAESN